MKSECLAEHNEEGRKLTSDNEYWTIDDFGKIGRGKSKHRPRNDPELYNGAYPFIQTGDIKHAGLYVNTYTQTYNDKGLAQSKLWQPGVLCITIAANIAETAILKISACFPDSIIGFTPHRKKSDVIFVKYCLDGYKLQIQAISQGTTQDNLSLEKLRTIRFRKFSFPVQRKVAAVLSAYDDLIENNNRRIAILEKMAEEIYREWFVRMRFPGYKKAKFRKGMPNGWDAVRLGTVIELAYGKALKETVREGGKYPVFGSSGVVGSHNKYLVTGPGIIVGRKGNVGSVHWSDNNFYPIDTVFYVKSAMSLYYLFFALKSLNFLNADAAVPGLNRKQAYSNIVYRPDSSLLKRFDGLGKSMFGLRHRLHSENETLNGSRDLLLSRLITGKLPVEDLDIKFPPSMRNPETPEEKAADG